jgi:phage shock protein PspC (stress-responsive transcriptional regulator)
VPAGPRPAPDAAAPPPPPAPSPTAPLDPTLTESDPDPSATGYDDPGRHWGRYGRRDWSAHEHRHHRDAHAHVGRRIRSLRRSPDNRVLGGVCGAVSRQTGIDVTWVRVGCVLACIFMGGMVLVYAVAWMMIPMEGQETTIFSRAVKDKHGIRLVVAVLIPVLVLTTVLTSTLHVPVVGFISWPTLIAVALLVLIWRNANDSEKHFIDHEVVPLLGTDFHGRARHLLVIRIVAGVIIGGLGIALLVGGHATLDALKPVGGAALVIAAAVIVFGPWWLSLVRDLIAERQARVRAEDRAQMAAHVHDSVLQTLALIQRSPDDAQSVLRLARAQERELRAWLFEGRSPGSISEDATMLGEGVNLL